MAGVTVGARIEATRATAATLIRLRWRLLRGAIRRGGTEQLGAVLSLVAATLLGLGVGGLAIGIGRGSAHADDLAVIFCSIALIASIGFGVVTGISQPIDPRVLAAEPLGDRERAGGMLAASAFGPPGLAALAIALGLAIGMVRDIASVPIVIPAVAAWLLTLLLLARTATNFLALFVARAPRAGQLTAGAFGLVFYGAFQFVPALLGKLDDGERSDLAGVLAWWPPGQLGLALGDAGDDVGRALWHLLLGAAWLPLLIAGYVTSTRLLSMSTRRAGGHAVSLALSGSTFGLAVRRSCGTGAPGAIAWRTLLTRFRTPRSALETFTGAGIGLAAVLVPTLLRDTAGSGAVLVGGAVQLAILFMAGNSFGTDGPAVVHELLAGTELGELVRGKARAIAIVGAPLALVGPLVAAAVTGEWRYLAAGFGVGIGSVFAGTGAALVQSALVPIAMPESDNPFASGESGKGILAGLLLMVVLACLAIATVPVALGLLWVTERAGVALVTLAGVATIGAGWLVLTIAMRVAIARLAGREPEFVLAITPAR